jgi:hypothetical protein
MHARASCEKTMPACELLGRRCAPGLTWFCVLLQVLRNPPAAPAIINSTGKLDPPLGQNRLKILEVVHALASLKNVEVEAKMIELGVLPTVLDLFFKYEWHNFLHNLTNNLIQSKFPVSFPCLHGAAGTLCESALLPCTRRAALCALWPGSDDRTCAAAAIITGENRAIKESLFTDGKILTRIIDAHGANDEALKQPKSCRKGYMGQLRLISNAIQKQAKGGGDSCFPGHAHA